MAKGNGKISELDKIVEITNDTIFEAVGEAEGGTGLDNYQATALQIEEYINREEGAVRESIAVAVEAETDRAKDAEKALSDAVEAESDRAKDAENELSGRQDELAQAIVDEQNRAMEVEGDVEELETVDKSNLVVAINSVKKGGNANAQEITKLQKNLADLGEHVDQRDDETLEEAKEYAASLNISSQTWLSAVNEKINLPVTGLNYKINYLCRVIADPVQANNGVYQAIAGWSDAPEWTYFSDNQDWIDETELDERIGAHDLNEGAHGGIKTDLLNEIQERAEETLATREMIAGEAQARTEADDAVLEEAKTYTDTKTTQETEARQSADQSLQTAIGNEAQSRENAVGDEAQAREQADRALQQAIEDEVSAREATDNELQVAITALSGDADATEELIGTFTAAVSEEATARSQADQGLQTAINNEATARQQADQVLQEAMGNEVQARQKIEKSTEFTFIIDSNAALAAWAANAPSNDYSRILIKEGTWEYTDTLALGTGGSPKVIIDISNGRTKSVVGESNSKIFFNSPSASYRVGIKGSENTACDYFLENVTVEFNGNVTGATLNTGFLNCANLTNCACTTDGGGAVYSFNNCTNLINCTGKGRSNNASGIGFTSCTNLTNCISLGTSPSGIYAFSNFNNCTNLINCTGSCFDNCTSLINCTGKGSTVGGGAVYSFNNCTNLINCVNAYSGDVTCFGFRNCRTGFGCKATTTSTAAIFNQCYMEQVSGTTPWANTAAGGYNLE